MASHAELAHTGIVDALTALGRELTIRRDGEAPLPPGSRETVARG